MDPYMKSLLVKSFVLNWLLSELPYILNISRLNV